MAKAQTPQFECSYCNQQFVLESRFLKHYCREMQRADEFKTPIGQAAWSFYKQWMKAHKRTVHKSESFLNSKYYKAFVDFARFVKRVGLPRPETFIWLMKERKISPTLWTNDEVYSMYLEFLDRKSSPLTQASITIDTLFKIADTIDINVDQIFDILTANEILQFIRKRQMSPWFLLHSKKFREFIKNKITKEEQTIFESMVRPSYWKEKFRKYPEDVEKIRRYVKELNL